jgi:hypothetical protein
VVPLAREVLPQEEFGGAVIDGVAEFGKCSEDDGREGWFAVCLEPRLRVSKDETHYVRPASYSADAYVCVFEIGD